MIDRVANANAAGWPPAVRGANENQPAQTRFSMRTETASSPSVAASADEHAALFAGPPSLTEQLRAEFGEPPAWLVESVREAVADDPSLAELALHAGVPIAPPAA